MHSLLCCTLFVGEKLWTCGSDEVHTFGRSGHYSFRCRLDFQRSVSDEVPNDPWWWLQERIRKTNFKEEQEVVGVVRILLLLRVKRTRQNYLPYCIVYTVFHFHFTAMFVNRHYCAFLRFTLGFSFLFFQMLDYRDTSPSNSEIVGLLCFRVCDN